MTYSLLAVMLVLTPVLSQAQTHKLTQSQPSLTPEMLSQQNDTVLSLFASTSEESEGQYGTIKNVALGSDSCLTLQADNSSVAFESCQDTARQHWKLSQIMTGYLKITSQALAGEAEESCLAVNTSAASPEPKMIACVGSGYTSMRSWKAVINATSGAAGIVYTLANKYRGDLGRAEVLGYNVNRLQMVAAASSDDVTWQLTVPDITQKREVMGAKKILLLHTHYSDAPANDLAPIQTALFGSGTDYSSLAGAVRVASYGKVTLTGDTLSDINLGPRPEACSSSVVAQAKALAREKGVEPDNYDYTFIEIPATSCNWSGLAQTPGNWIIGNASGYKPWMWQHEFGHNLGAKHATSLENCTVNSDGITQLDQQCKSTTASDPSDTMNGGGSRLYPAPYLFYTGWLTNRQMPLVSQPGNYTLTPLFTAPKDDELKGIRILRRDGTYLTLEYRQPLKGFETWASDDPFVNGVIVRVISFGGTILNTLVDTTPGSANGMKDAPLMPGKSIDDVLSGKRITLIGVNAEGAHVHIDNIPGSNEQYVVPEAVIPDNFSIVARHSDTTVRILDGSKSTGSEFVWRSLGGAKPFGLQEAAGGSPIAEVRTSAARATFLGGYTGEAKYQLTVTGSHGMTDSKIVTVTVLPAKVEISAPDTLAQGHVHTINAQANFEAAIWHWSLKSGETVVAESTQPAFEVESQRYAVGTYQIELEASSADGKYLASATKPVSIAEAGTPEYPGYVEGTNYAAGDRVTVAGMNYSCKPAPFTAWCAGAAWAYAPGTGSHWEEAWDVVDRSALALTE
ncbi:hypothetical protein [Pantoea sp. BAV 3049]|uniref:hypothetical protein n=1 Tax=Pantoea sp. BAV 3049 TaxID=2654188 RepID=UPI00131C8042|nr:hypothetical protein [Pantoea sp. BAV 3049]